MRLITLILESTMFTNTLSADTVGARPAGRGSEGGGHQTADCTERGLSPGSPHGRGLPPQDPECGAWTERGLSRSRAVLLPPRLKGVHARLAPGEGEASREAAPTKLHVSGLGPLASRKPSAAAAPPGRTSTRLRLRSSGQFSHGDAKGGAPRPALLGALLVGDLLCRCCSC